MISSRGKKKHPEREREILSYTPGESWCWTSNEKSGGAGSATSDFSGNGRSETGFSTSNERSGSGGSPTSCFSALGRSETGKTPKDWEKKRRKAKPIRTNETDILIQMWLCLWRDPGFQSNLFSFTIFFSQREQKQQEKKIKKISSKTQRTASCHTPHTTLSLSTLLSCIHCYYYVTLWNSKANDTHREKEKETQGKKEDGLWNNEKGRWKRQDLCLSVLLGGVWYSLLSV